MPHFKPPHNAEFTSKSFAASCDLCGLPLRTGSHPATHADRTYRFCCQGCRQVFSILIEASDAGDPAGFRQTELFKQCQEMGIIPRSEADLLSSGSDEHQTRDSRTSGFDQQQRTTDSSISTENVLGLNLKIANMWCPACAWLIDESLKKTPGVIDSTCNFSTDRLQVNFNPVKTSPDQITVPSRKLATGRRSPMKPGMRWNGAGNLFASPYLHF
jgi:hypothetical protein